MVPLHKRRPPKAVAPAGVAAGAEAGKMLQIGGDLVSFYSKRPIRAIGQYTVDANLAVIAYAAAERVLAQ